MIIISLWMINNPEGRGHSYVTFR